MTTCSDSRYFLAYRAIGKPFRLPITAERFEALKQAWSNLAHFAHFEEGWAAIVQNYMELETALIGAALRDMVVSELDYFAFQQRRLEFGVRLANLLNSCRAYVDHTPQTLNSIAPHQPYEDEFKKLANAEYEKRFGYRFMEALRNHSQHCGLPIHSTQYSSAWVEGGEDGMLGHSVATHITLDILRKNKKFKKSVIEDVTEERLQAEPLVRDYLEGLSAVHIGMRKRLSAPFEAAANTIREAIAEYVAAAGEPDAHAIYAIELEHPNTWVQQVPLIEELIQVTEKMRRKNRPMVNLARRFVTSSTVPIKRKAPTKGVAA